MKKYLSAYVNDHFAKTCLECQDEPILIEKYKKPHVVMISSNYFNKLCSKSTEDDWARLATTAFVEGFMDDEEVDNWLTSVREEEYKRAEDNTLNDQNFYRIKISKSAQGFLGNFASDGFLKLIDGFFDDKFPSRKLGKWPYRYKDIGTYRFIYDIENRWHRLIYISLKSKFQTFKT